jgi:hypothetical protein
MKDENFAEQQAIAQFASIKEMVENIKKAQESENDSAFDDAKQIIFNDPLSIQVRSNWHNIGETAVNGL